MQKRAAVARGRAGVTRQRKTQRLPKKRYDSALHEIPGMNAPQSALGHTRVP